MSSTYIKTDIKEIVREKYGQAALRLKTAEAVAGGLRQAGLGSAIRLPPTFMTSLKPRHPRGCGASVARLRQSDCIGTTQSRERRCLISGRAAELTFGCRPSEWGQAAKHTG